MKKQTGLTKRFLAGLVTVAMCFSMLPTGAWAEGAEEADPAAGGTTSAADDAVTEATPQTSPGGEAKTGDEDKEPADGEAVPADEDKEPAAGEEGEPIPMSEEEPGISLLSFGAVEIAEMQIKIGSSVYTSGQTAMANIDGNFELSFKLGGDPSWVNRTVDIDVPVGWKIVAAPGVSGIKDDGTIQAKSYTPEEQITFASAPTFVWDGVKTVAGVTTVKTKSGTLSYEIKDNTVGYVITVTMAADSTLYDFSGAQNLKDLTISFTGVDSTDPDTTSNDKKSIGAQLGTGSMANTARVAVNTNQYANTTAQDGSEVYLGQEQYVYIAPLEDLMVPKNNISKQVYGLSFNYTYPKGAVVEVSATTQTGGWSKSGEAVDNGDDTMTQKFTCSAAKAIFGNDARMDGRYRCRLKLTYPEGMTEFVEGGTYTTTVSDLSWKTLTIDENEDAVACVHTANNEATTVTKIIETPDFRPPYALQVQNAEAKNGYDGVQMQLAYMRMYLKTGTGVAIDPGTGLPIVSGSSASKVRFSYQGDPLDNVSYISIPVSSTDVKTNLSAIHIEYKDGTSDWTKGVGTMPGAITYYSVGTEQGTAWRFTVPAGKYIKSAYVEYTQVTPTEAMANPAGYGIAKGRPVNEEYTGIFSHHEFFTQQWDAANNQWVTVSTSNIDGEDADNYQKETDHGGFRWIKPDPFELNATGINKTTSNSFAALGNTKEEETLDPVMPGAVKLASYEFSNQTGNKCTDQVKVDIALNQNGNQDLVSLVQFPYSYVADADEAAKQVESITYTYTDGTTETWTKASGKPYPFTPGSTSGTMTAPDGKYFASVSVTLTGWNASLQTSSVYLAGKPATDRYEGETSSHKITVTPVSGTDPFCSTSAGFNFRKATAQYVAPAGTAIEVDAGTDGVLKVNLKAGYRSSNGIGGLQEECSQHYGHSTFAFILPNDLTPTGTALTVTWPENTLGYPTTTATLQSKHSATDAELAAANMVGLSATVYTYAFADQDMTWISRYGGANTTPQVSLPFEVDPLADNYLFTYAQLFYAGSNLTADMNGGTQPALNCPTEGVVTYTNGDKDVVVSTTRYTDNGFDTKVGVTDNIIRGDSATVKINRNPSLIVREHIAASDGVDKVYDGTDDSIAKFKEGETGTIKLNVFNAVSEAAGVKVKYGFVFVPIPKASANSDQVTDHQFDFVLGGVPTYDYVTSDISSIEAHYVMGTTSVNAGNAETIYNAASTTYNANATMVAFRLEDLIAGKGMGITIPIKAPDFVTDTALYDQLQARSVYVYNDEGAWTTYNAGEKYGYLRASYVNPRWTLTCNTQGGSTVASQTVKDGEQWVTPATPTRGGYTFGGWYTDAACTDGKEYKTFPVTPSEDKTIYAKWVETTYTVQYDTTGGTPATIDDKTEVKWSDANLLPAAPTRAGYTFGGWNTKEDGTGITATAASKYSDLAATPAAASVTLYAQWHEQPDISITYASEDTQKGTVTPANESLAPASGSAQGSTAAAKPGYHFAKWTNNLDATETTDATLTKAQVDAVAKATGIYVAAAFTAHFAPDDNTKYVVQYYQQNRDDNDYTEVTADKTDKTGTTDTAIDTTVLDKTYEGFTRDHVTYENSSTTASTVVLNIAGDGSLVVKVYYNRDTYNVHYDANGHATAPTGQTDVRYGALVTDPGNLSATGYDFGGWYTDAACTDANKWDFATDTMPDEDVTLYAKWTPKQFTVAFATSAGGDIGGTTADQTVDYLGHAAAGCTATPADSDHEFLGWRYHYTAVDGTLKSGTVTDYTTVPVEGPSDGKLTFTAIFAKKPFTAIRGTNGLVSIAKDTEPVTPTQADDMIELSATDLPATLNMKFQPADENYTLATTTDAFVVMDVAGNQKVLTNGPNTFTPQGQTEPITIVVDTTAGTIKATDVNDSLEFDVVYEAIRTTYTVQHYLMDADGINYTLQTADTETMPSATTTIEAGSAITFTPKNYTGANYVAGKTTYQDSVVTTPQTTATTVKFDGSTIVKLYYDRVGHTVSFNVQSHGIAPADKTNVLYGATFTAPTEPTEAGYTFGGWYTDATCTAEWDFDNDTMPNNDMTLYAKWTEDADVPISYASEDTAQGNVDPASEDVAPATGTAVGSTATPEPGYHFVKWTNSLDATETTDATLSAAQVDAVAKTTGIYEEVTFTAHFAEDADVTITYASEDTAKGSVDPASEDVAPVTGNADGSEATPATGYYFVNWTNNLDATVTSDAILTQAQVDAVAKASGIYEPATFTANFAANAYTVEFNPGDGSGTPMPDQGFTYDEEKPLSSNTYTKPGYHFIGWDTERTADNVVYNDAQSVKNLTAEKDGTVTLYAVWAEDGQVTLTYNATTGGSVTPASESVSPATGTANGSAASADAGYHFVKWTNNINTTETTDATLSQAQVDAVAKLSGVYTPTTFTANFAPNTYEVVFDGNGSGDPAMPNQSFTYEVAQNLDSNTYTRAGFTFAGWATTLDATAAEYTDAQSVKNLTTAENGQVTLYAVWTETAPVTLTYMVATTDNAKGSVAPLVESVKPVSGTPVGSTATAKPGYHFEKWTNDQTGDATTDAVLTPAQVQTAAKSTGVYLATTFTAHFAPDTDTAYTVEYYRQNIDDNDYTKVDDDTANATGTTDAAINGTLLDKTYPGFTKDKVTYEKTGTTASTTVLTIAPDGSLLVKVYYTRHAHDVTFDANGHSTAPSGQTDVRYGDLVTDPGNLTATGYDFGGWYTDAACTDANKWDFATTTMPDNDVTLYAKWTPKLYTVTFTNTGANSDKAALTGDDPQDVPYGSKPDPDCTCTITAADPTEYEVVGWKYNYTAADGTTKQGIAIGATGYKDVEIFGNVTFDAVIYKVPFVTATGVNGFVSIAKTVGELTDPTAKEVSLPDITYPTLPTSAAVQFKPENENYKLVSVTVSDYQTTPAKVVFSGNDLADGKTLTLATVDKAGDPVNVNLTLKLDAGGNTGHVSSGAANIGTSTIFTVVYEAIQTHYKVEHYLMGTDGNYPSTPTADETLPASGTIAAGSTITFTPNTYPGAGYDATLTTYQDSETPASATVTTVKHDGSTVVKLYYKRSTHTVTYNAQGYGTAPAPKTGVVNGATFAAPTDTDGMTQPGYTWDTKWYTDAACTTEWNFATDAMPNSDLTLYAKWTENAAVTIRYSSENTDMGTVNNAQDVVKPATGTAAGSTAAVKPGYKFVNWTKKSDGSVVSTSLTLLASELKVGGIYVAETYIANFVPDTDTEYKVEYYRQDATGTGYTQVTGDALTKYGTTGMAIDPSVLNKTYPPYFTKSKVTYTDNVHGERSYLTIAPDGSLVVRVYYNRILHNVTFDPNGHGMAPDDESVRHEGLATKPTDPTADGYTFTGWFLEDGTPYNFATPVTEDLKLVAGWKLTPKHEPGDNDDNNDNGNNNDVAPDETEPAAGVQPTSAPVVLTVPKTSDDTPLTLLLVLMALSAVGLVVAMLLKKRKNKHK